MKKYFYILLLIVFSALIFEALPFGVVLHFGEQDGTVIERTFSYFNLTPWGYACLGPLPTAVLTVALSIILIIGCFKEKRSLLLTCAIVSAVAALISVLPFIDKSFTWITGIVTLLLCGTTVCGFIGYKKHK